MLWIVGTGVALASGLAATTTIVHMLKAGDGIVCMNDVYGGEPRADAMESTHVCIKHSWRKAFKYFTVSSFCLSGTNRYFKKIAAEIGYDISFADCTKLEELKAALKPNTKVRTIKN